MTLDSSRNPAAGSPRRGRREALLAHAVVGLEHQRRYSPPCWFGRVLPSASEPARAAWILAALALASCIVFWSGLPFVLDMGAVYCGGRAVRSAPAALGALAIVLAFVGCAVG